MTDAAGADVTGSEGTILWKLGYSRDGPKSFRILGTSARRPNDVTSVKRQVLVIDDECAIVTAFGRLLGTPSGCR